MGQESAFDHGDSTSSHETSRADMEVYCGVTLECFLMRTMAFKVQKIDSISR